MAAIATAEIASPLGRLLAGATDAGVCQLEFTDDTNAAPRTGRLGHPHLDQLAAELADYFAGRLTEFRTPLAVEGTAFQRKVWAALRRIPYGATQSYRDVAAAVGAPAAVRAVGQANGRNRIAIVIPCHRVIAAGGGIGGYGGGLWRKEFLLDLERHALDRR